MLRVGHACVALFSGILILASTGCATLPSGTSTVPSGASQPTPTAPQPQQEIVSQAAPVKVTLGTSTATVSYAPIILATERGYFLEQGLDVNWVTLTGGAATGAAFLAGDVDIMGGASLAPLKMIAEGKGVQIIYGLQKQHTLMLAVNKASVESRGIDVTADLSQKLGKLKGITLGTASAGGTAETTIRWILRKGGLNDQDVSVVAVGSGSAPVAALENHQIDAFAAAPPSPVEAVQRGQAVILYSPDEIPELSKFLFTVLYVKKEYAEKNPEVMGKLVHGLDRAKQSMRDDPDAAVRDLKNAFPKMQDETLRASIKVLDGGFGVDGRMDEASWRTTIAISKEIAGFQSELNSSEGAFWTNRYFAKQ